MTREQQIDYLIAYTVDKMSQYLIEDFKLDIASALNVIYNSKVYGLIEDKENELYIQSPAYIYELLKKEFLTATL